MENEKYNLRQKGAPAWFCIAAALSILSIPTGIALTYIEYVRNNIFSIQSDSISIMSKIQHSTNCSWIYTSTALFICGIFSFFCFKYFDRNIKSRIIYRNRKEKFCTEAGLKCLYLFAIGQSLVGLFPMDINKYNFPCTETSMYYLRAFHYLGGYFAYYGFFIGFCLLFPSLWRNRIMARKVLLMYLSFIIGLILLYIIYGICQLIHYPFDYLIFGYFNDNVFEWAGLFILDGFGLQVVYYLLKNENPLGVSEQGWLRVESAIEIIIAFLMIISYIWLMSDTYNISVRILGLVPLVFLLKIAKRHHNETFRMLGIRFSGLFKSLLCLVPISMIAAFIIYYFWQKSFPVQEGLSSFHANTGDAAYFLILGFVQVYILSSFLFRRYRDLFNSNVAAVLAASVTFSLFFYPNNFMMLFILTTSIIWCLAYARYQNIISIALVHSALLFFVASILMAYTAVGPDCDKHRWTSEVDPVLLDVTSVEGLGYQDGGVFFVSDARLIKIARPSYIAVTGVIELKDKEASIESASIYFDDREYPLPLKKIVDSKFSENLLLKDTLKRAYYKLQLRVRVKTGIGSYEVHSGIVWVKAMAKEQDYMPVLMEIRNMMSKNDFKLFTEEDTKFIKKELSYDFQEIKTIFNPDFPDKLVKELDKLEKTGRKAAFILSGANSSFLKCLKEMNLIEKFKIKEIQTELKNRALILTFN